MDPSADRPIPDRRLRSRAGRAGAEREVTRRGTSRTGAAVAERPAPAARARTPAGASDVAARLVDDLAYPGGVLDGADLRLAGRPRGIVEAFAANEVLERRLGGNLGRLDVRVEAAHEHVDRLVRRPEVDPTLRI